MVFILSKKPVANTHSVNDSHVSYEHVKWNVYRIYWRLDINIHGNNVSVAIDSIWLYQMNCIKLYPNNQAKRFLYVSEIGGLNILSWTLNVIWDDWEYLHVVWATITTEQNEK